MKTVEYIGTTEELGRFGTVRRGDSLRMFEHEWDSVSLDPRFNLIGGTPAMFGAHPKLTDAYDLRKVPWGKSSTIFFQWLKEQGKVNLLQIALGMAQAGVEFDVLDGASPIDELADKVQELANCYGWSEMTEDEIWNGPKEQTHKLPESPFDDPDDAPPVKLPAKKKRKYVRRKK